MLNCKKMERNKEIMEQNNKTTQSVSLRMKMDLFRRFTDFCESSGQSKTVAIERALSMYIDDYVEKMKLIKENSRER